jgi:hypothetical protein
VTDAQLKKLAKENNIEPTYELLAFARLVLINAKIQDLKLVAINTRLAVEKERQAIWDILIDYASRDDLSDDDESLLAHLGSLIKAREKNDQRPSRKPD